MIRHSLPLAFFMLFCSILLAQNTFTINGNITDSSSNESIFGASISFKNDKTFTGTTSNEYGFYSMTLPKGTYQVEVSYIGFQTNQFELSLTTVDIRRDIVLSEQFENLEEVILEIRSDKVDVRTPQMSKNVITTAKIKETPTLFGEPDIIRSLLLLPGVTNGGEISSGFNVRGGSVDQNLVLLDEAVLFTTSHLFGLLSVFNAFAIKDITLYKGGIPSRYGGRVSSVLDVYQREGNSKTFKGELFVGTLSMVGVFEGPLKKDKGSFLLAVRGTPVSLFTIRGSTSGFYDINAKLSYELNSNNKVYLSGYFGRDTLSLDNLFKNTYGNALINARWNHLFNSKLFSNLSMIYSDYNYGLDFALIGFNWTSSIKNFNIKYDFKHYLSENLKVYYGLNNVYYAFDPGKIVSTGDDNNFGIKTQKLTNKYANELSLYIGANQKITNKLQIDYGLRISRFDRFGQEFNIYENDNPVDYDPDTKVYSEANEIGVKTTNRSESVADFTNLEPRVALSYAMNDNNSIKLSYNRMAQYLQIVSNASSPTPFNVWAPSGPFVKPILLDQYAIGFFKTIADKYSLEVEGYYKDTQNKVDYIDGADLIVNNAIERILLNGKARAYGLELLFRKNLGKLTGWISYTLATSEQQTLGRTPDEIGINEGEWYKTPYNKLHDLSITGNYKFNDKWSFNANFIFQTGRAATFPTGKYVYQGLIIPKYSARNSDQYPAYHRMDIGTTLTPRKNKTRKWKSKWIFSIYNVYGRKNAFVISFEPSDNDPNVSQAFRTHVFEFLPSISYNIKF